MERRLGGTTMRQPGHRDKKPLYRKIMVLLKDFPEGLNPYQIALRLKANHCTIRRTYLPDLVKQGKLTATPIEKRQVLYRVVTGERK
jgi:hypothetical protein